MGSHLILALLKNCDDLAPVFLKSLCAENRAKPVEPCCWKLLHQQAHHWKTGLRRQGQSELPVLLGGQFPLQSLTP